jgi:AcrR family transcriptional regulator
MAAPQQRRRDTRQRIQDVALELFAERGYEKTSLREIAERLDVTKAALYYHFKTKEDILVSLFEDLVRPLDELIVWATAQPRTLETKQELLRRYSAALTGASALFLFMQDNQATVRELRIGQHFRDRMSAMAGLIMEPESSLTDKVRSVSALFTVHFAMFALQDIEGEPEDKRKAVLEVAGELLASTRMPAP